jgi:DNA-binding NarL/FixJ family response regulator
VIRILIVDNQIAIRVGLASILGAQRGLKVVGSAVSGEDALDMIERQMPDLMLLDLLRMRQMNGIALLEEVARRRYPLRSIVLTNCETCEDVYRAVSAGAHGYLLKSYTERELVDAIFAVHSGKIYLPQDIASKLASRMHRASLSTRELEVLRMTAKGLTNKQIASSLGISDNTARTHLANITEKLDAADRTEAVTTAIKLGVLQLD